MFAHWRYVLDELFGSVRGVFALGATHIPIRYDEQGDAYEATAEDAAYAMFELDEGVIAQLNSSWCVRVDRGELFELQVDGTEGTRGRRAARLPAAAGRGDSPVGLEPGPAGSRRPPGGVDAGPGRGARQRVQGAVGALPAPRGSNEPFPWDFYAGARGVQLSELGLQSWHERRWVEVPAL